MWHQSKARKVVSGFTVCVGLAAFYALEFSHFVPSSVWAQTSLYAALGCGVGGGWLAFLPPPPNPLQSRLLSDIWIRVPAFTALFFFIGYQAFAAGFPAWYTDLAGSPREQIVTVDKWRRPGWATCGGPDLKEAPMVQTLCLSVSQGLTTRPGIKLLLQGKGTMIGINVSSVKPAPD